jgi:hypothetical protein
MHICDFYLAAIYQIAYLYPESIVICSAQAVHVVWYVVLTLSSAYHARTRSPGICRVVEGAHIKLVNRKEARRFPLTDVI